MADAEHSSIGHGGRSNEGPGTQYNVTGSGLQLLHSGTGDQNVNSGQGTQFNYIVHGSQITEPNVVQDCQKSLAFSEMNDRPNDIEGAIDGTCEWLRQHAAFQDWIKCDRGLLWIKGKPGSGKSTLLKYMLRRAEEEFALRDNSIALSFFFHGRGTDLQKSLLGLFRSLLHQLSIRVPESISTLMETFKKRYDTIGRVGEKWQWHARELQELFASSLSNVLNKESVWLFVDALDECGEENAAHLIDYLKLLMTKLPPTAHPFRVCFSCRHYPILELDYGLAISMEHVNHGDIATFVKTQLSTLDKGPASTITDTITRRADGVFMWARLVVKEVLALTRKGEGVGRIQLGIQRIPPDLDDLYHGLLRSMEHRARSRELIQWICFSTSPLSVDELREAMTVRPDCCHTTLQQCEESEEYPRTDGAMERKINTLSCGLAEIVLYSNLRIVQFIHQSVEDFFMTKGLSALAALDGVQISSSLAASRAHYDLYRTCIRYLSMDEIARITTGFTEDDKRMSMDNFSWFEEPISVYGYRFGSDRALSFLRYATISWMTHARQGDIEGVYQRGIHESLNWPPETFLQLWMPLYRRIVPSSRVFLGNGTSLLHVASRLRLEQLLSFMLNEADRSGVNINCRDAHGWTPLTHAVFEGHKNIINLLLNTEKVDVEARDYQGRTPLSQAALGGHEGVVQLLLTTGKADVETKDDRGRTPLWWAAWRGDEGVLKLLINTGRFDIEARDNQGCTPLCKAALEGHEGAIQLLIDIGKADIQAEDQNGRTPLWWAAWGGHVGALRALLHTGEVDIEERDSLGRTPISIVAFSGGVNALKFLLDTGRVNIEAKDYRGHTPLWWAIWGGHEHAVEFLLDTGKFDIETRDENGRSLLWTAIWRNVEPIVKLLIDTGRFDIEDRDRRGHSLVWWANMRGLGHIAKLLLDTGRAGEA